MTQQGNSSADTSGTAAISDSGGGPVLTGATAIKQFFVEPIEAGEHWDFLIQAITNAQQSVWLEVYLLTHRSILAALEQTAKPDPQTGQKKDIRVIVQKSVYPQFPSTGGGYHMLSYQELTQQLNGAGIEVRENSTPLDHWGVTHAKFMIIDGQTAYIMTANMTVEALGSTGWRGRPQLADNREYIVVDEDPERVKTLAALFAADWDSTLPRFNTSQLQSSALVVSPSYGDQGNAHDVLLALLRSAQKTLLIEMEVIHEDYPDQEEIEKALTDAVKRSVAVQVVLHGAGPTSGGKTEQRDLDFLKGGYVQVRTSQQPVMHAKMILVDAQYEGGQVTSGLAFVGSQNLTTAALKYNREIGILIADPSVLTKLWQKFWQDWGSAQSG